MNDQKNFITKKYGVIFSSAGEESKGGIKSFLIPLLTSPARGGSIQLFILNQLQ